MDLNITRGAYSIKAPIALQESLNLYTEVEQGGALERIVLRRFPGLRRATDMSAAIRGMYTMAGVLYVVAGTTLYSISSGEVATSIGTIAGTDRVSMAVGEAVSATTRTQSLCIVNGTTTMYDYTSGTLSTTTLDFAANKIFSLDQYMVLELSSGTNFYLSNFNAPTTFTATDIGGNYGGSDQLVSVFVSHRDIILFGERTMETHRNIGSADFAFARQEGTFQERGATGKNSPANIDNTTYFLGDDKIVYALEGYRPRRISHHAIEDWLRDQTQTDLDNAIGMTINFSGHFWYVLSFNKGTWVFDITTSALLQEHSWFQLQSYGQQNWRVEHVVNAYGKVYAGGPDGVLYELTHNVLNEDGFRQIKRRVTPYYQADRTRMTIDKFEVAFEEATATASVAQPLISLEVSKDRGRTWSSKDYRDMGELGDYSRVAVWRRLGLARSWIFRLEVADDVEVTLTGGYADIQYGSG